MKSYEKNKQLENISFNYLLTMVMFNLVWVAYACKVNNMDLKIIYGVGVAITMSFFVLFLYVKYKVGKLAQYLPRLAVGLSFTVFASSSLTDENVNGLIATTLSMCSFLFILEDVKGVL